MKRKGVKIMKLKNVLSLFFVFSMLPAALADTIYDYTGDVEYSAGTGSNQATIAIDFDADSSFLFTYNWDGIADGWDALDSIDLAGLLDITAIDYGAMGMLVSDFDYPGGIKYDYGQGADTGWGYYNSADGTNWSLNGTGVSFRDLSNGDWDSWVWSNYDYDVSWDPVRTPGAEPVPEPFTLAVLGLGSLFLRKRGA